MQTVREKPAKDYYLQTLFETRYSLNKYQILLDGANSMSRQTKRSPPKDGQKMKVLCK